MRGVWTPADWGAFVLAVMIVGVFLVTTSILVLSRPLSVAQGYGTISSALVGIAVGYFLTKPSVSHQQELRETDNSKSMEAIQSLLPAQRFYSALMQEADQDSIFRTKLEKIQDTLRNAEV